MGVEQRLTQAIRTDFELPLTRIPPRLLRRSWLGWMSLRWFWSHRADRTHVARSLRDREWAWNNASPGLFTPTSNSRCPGYHRVSCAEVGWDG